MSDNIASPVAGERIVIPHADDVGMCHGANRAYMEIAGRGFVTTGSVMVLCPWFGEIAEWAGGRDDADLGVHLTLTSEWRHYRWGPISTRSKKSGLIDNEGCFPHRVPELRATLDPIAADDEMRAQIECFIGRGMRPTHIDTHMGAAMVPELIDITIAIARDYRLPLLFPRTIESYLDVLDIGPVDPAFYRERHAGLEAEGATFVDRFIMTPWVASDAAFARYSQMIESLRVETTFFSLHPNAPGDIEVICPNLAHCRTDEYRLAVDRKFLSILEREKVRIEGFSELRDQLNLPTRR